MTPVQRFFTAIFPARWAESMQAESQSWKVKCNNCGHAESVWDLGGIRWKASGNPRILRSCRNCGQRACVLTRDTDQP